MIRSFGDAATRDLFLGKSARKWMNIERIALRKLAMLNRARSLDDLRIPTGNRLKALKGDLAGYHSIRINDQFRVVFVWRASEPHDVSMVDYH